MEWKMDIMTEACKFSFVEVNWLRLWKAKGWKEPIELSGWNSSMLRCEKQSVVSVIELLLAFAPVPPVAIALPKQVESILSTQSKQNQMI
jgi:hypothetical protein